ncbi:MAG: MFS transporter [Syntrophus sp. (in: bacteria)]|nr:MFS transporter [Syntrophus sp. (in: bacteria)]
MAIYLIVLMCALNHSAFGGSRVAVSLYALNLGANQLAIGVLMAFYGLCPMLLAVTIGKLADRVGPRLPMLMGTTGVAVALLLPPLFPGLATLYISALLIGTSFHFFFVTVTGIAGGIGGEGNRVRNYALVSLGFSGAGFMGPMAAGFSIDHLGHLPTFLLLSLFTLIPLLLIWFRSGFLPPAVKRGMADGKRNAYDLWRVPVLRNTFIASGIISSAWDLFQFYLPIYGYSIGLSASAIGTVLGVFALATFVIRIVLPRLIKKSRESEILAYAIFVAAFAFVLFPFFKNAYALAAIAFLLGLGCGCGQPLSMSLIYALSPRERVSESTGLRVTVNNFAHLVIPLLFGSVGTAFGYFPVFISNSALLVAGGFLMRRNITPAPGPS